jgi:hypothetical protein
VPGAFDCRNIEKSAILLLNYLARGSLRKMGNIYFNAGFAQIVDDSVTGLGHSATPGRVIFS